MAKNVMLNLQRLLFLSTANLQGRSALGYFGILPFNARWQDAEINSA
ncbi:MAG: hypothetical protein WCF95_05445 [bacterium]